MKIPKEITVLIVLSLLVVGLSVLLYNTHTKLKGVEESNAILLENIDSQKEENSRIIDSMQILKENYIEQATRSQFIADSVKREFENIQYDETPVDNITDPNRIDSLFTRYYPRN